MRMCPVEATVESDAALKMIVFVTYSGQVARESFLLLPRNVLFYFSHCFCPCLCAALASHSITLQPSQPYKLLEIMTSPAQELTTETELTPMVEPLPTHQHSEEAAMQQVSPATVNEEDNTSFSTDDLPEESHQAQPEPEVKDAIREEAPTVIGEERVEGCQTPNKRLREEAASSLEEMPKTQLTKLSPRSSQPLRSVTPISVQLLPALETAAAEGEDVEHVSAADTPQPTVAKADLSPIHSSQQDHPAAVDDLEDQN